MSGCLTPAELAERVGWSRQLAADSYTYWLERGIIERVNGGYRLTREWAWELEAFRPLPSERVPLSRDEVAEALDHCKPGPQKAAA